MKTKDALRKQVRAQGGPPKEIIPVESPFRRPKGIYWKILPREKIDAIPVLKAICPR